MMSALKILPALSLLVFTTGCGEILSSEVDTEDIEAEILVLDDGQGPLVQAVLRLENSSMTYVQLTDGDTLEAAGQGQTWHRLRAIDGLGAYGVRLPPTPRVGGQIRVDLTRPADRSALDTRISLPPPFEFYPMAQRTYDLREDTISVEWDSTTRGAVDIDITGRCIEPFHRQVADTGRFDVHPWTLEVDDLDPCTLTISVARSSGRRAVSSALAGGFIEAVQQRQVSIYALP